VLAPATPTLTLSVAPVDAPIDAPIELTLAVAVGMTAVQIPVAVQPVVVQPVVVQPVQRLPATSTSDESGQPMAWGLLLASIGALLLLRSRKSAIRVTVDS
jgi:LPXTG-motif cell wall-anchored protein